MAEWWGDNWQWVFGAVLLPVLGWLAVQGWNTWQRERRPRWFLHPSTNGGESCHLKAEWMLDEPSFDVEITAHGGARITSFGGRSARRLECGDSRAAVFRWDSSSQDPKVRIAWRETSGRVRTLERSLRQIIRS